jgi:sugar lactone lactonase YvrE
VEWLGAVLLAVLALALAAPTASAVIAHLANGRTLSYQPLSATSAITPFDVLFSNVDYNGGPVMASNTNYAVYWAPSGAPAYPSDYQAGVNQYLIDLAHDSGGSENTDSVSTQYNDTAGDFASYSSHFGGALIDTDPYPANGCQQATICLTDAQLRAELTKYTRANYLPTDLAHEYFLLTPPGVEDCLEASGLECSAGSKEPSYCAYHGYEPVAGGELIYSNDPYVTGIHGCDDGNHPNGSTSDGAIEGGLSHEHNESITDPELNAWVDFTGGGSEIADKCLGFAGTALGQAPNGASYNQIINGHLYWYQELWSDQGDQCRPRLTFSGAEPTATFTSKAGPHNAVSFDATGSTAPGGVAAYDWQFNDGTGNKPTTPVETTTPTVTHTFATSGPYVVALTVFATDGTSIGSARTIEAGRIVSAPTAVTGAASSVVQTSATLNATVNPNAVEVSECKFEYGPSTAYGSSAPCTPPPGAGKTAVALSASVTGLIASTTYHFRVVARNLGGTSNGSDQTFATLPRAPTVETKAASSIAQTGAILNATVNPNGGEVSECKLEYGRSADYEASAPCTPSPGSGESAVAVSASITGLSTNTAYHFRVVATNLGGTSDGSDQTFATLPPAPTVETKAASSITETGAILNATVNPNGGEVSECKLEYGTSAGYGSSAPCAPSPGSGESPVAVSASLTGLAANTTYHFRVSASNAGGTNEGSGQTFATLPPSPPTFATSFTPENIEAGFSEPTAVALDPSGNIWVADSGHNRVLEFNRERRLLRQFGIEAGQVQSKGIQGIATNSAGDVYVSASDRVQEFSPVGEFLREWGSSGSGNGQFLDPNGIAVDSSGNVWVVDTFNYRVEEFSESGAFLSQFGSKGTGNGQFGWASGVAFSGGNLYVADGARVEEFTTAGTFIATFGSSGTGSGQFHGLGGIASDPTTGDLYVSDTYNNRVEKFTAAGVFLSAVGSGGSGNGQFSAPRGVTVSSTGTLYVADTANNRMQEWLAGEPPTFATSFAPAKIEGSFREPDAVAVDPSGDIWVADSGNNRVLEFSNERKFLRQFGSEGTAEGQFEGIAGIATNSSGDVYVSGSDRIQEFSPAGEFLRQWGSPGSGNGQFLFPTGIAVDSSGTVWVLDRFNYRVQEFSPSGAYLGQFASQGTGNGPLGWGFGLAFSGGNLYVADLGNGRVEEFSTTGALLGQFGETGILDGQFQGLWGIASDPTTGNLYVTDFGNDRVQEFSAVGTFLAAFGSPGSGNGLLSSPRAVAISSSGDVYVADTGNNRVQEWVPSP